MILVLLFPMQIHHFYKHHELVSANSSISFLTVVEKSMLMALYSAHSVSQITVFDTHCY